MDTAEEHALYKPPDNSNRFFVYKGDLYGEHWIFEGSYCRDKWALAHDVIFDPS